MFQRHRIRLLLAVLAALVVPSIHAAEPATRKTRNVIVATTDGLRWEDVFRGADPALLNKSPGGVADPEAAKAAFDRPTAEERRKLLMPFLWDEIASRGQIFGNRDKNSPARVTNGKNFSYPGYNELLTGRPDPRIDSNAKRPNPNVTVLEWLNSLPAYRGKVAAYGSWDVFPFILNRERSGLFINAGWEPIPGDDLSDRQRGWNRVARQLPRRWPDCRDDAVTLPLALEHLRRNAPRVLYISAGDTDEHGHAGRYDLVLDAAREFDADLARLWRTVQLDPRYRDTTSLIVSTDHGRGGLPDGWKSHGANVAGSEAIWIAVIGPDTPALGERRDASEVTQAQIAATAAALLGEDWLKASPESAPPIVDVLPPAVNR